MDRAQFVVRSLHVPGGIYWFGGALFGNFARFPAIIKLPENVQRSFTVLVLEKVNLIVSPVAIASIVFGFQRGTVLGRIHGLGDPGTASDIAWLSALTFAVGVLSLGY